jgi:hypothetical protein
MVSPNDHVVMNHQNQTRTNGVWGHVRYKIAQYLETTPVRPVDDTGQADDHLETAQAQK